MKMFDDSEKALVGSVYEEEKKSSQKYNGIQAEKSYAFI